MVYQLLILLSISSSTLVDQISGREERGKRLESGSADQSISAVVSSNREYRRLSFPVLAAESAAAVLG
ncbi:hypothetical protein Dimus_030343 [Dionaea muscipula]